MLLSVGISFMNAAISLRVQANIYYIAFQHKQGGIFILFRTVPFGYQFPICYVTQSMAGRHVEQIRKRDIPSIRLEYPFSKFYSILCRITNRAKRAFKVNRGQPVLQQFSALLLHGLFVRPHSGCPPEGAIFFH